MMQSQSQSGLNLNRLQRVLGRVLIYAILIIGAILVVGPFVWMLSTALTPAMEVFSWPPRLIPDTVMWENFVQASNEIRFPRLLVNSLIVSIIATVSAVFLSSLAGYALAKLRFPGRTILFLFFLGTVMIPAQITMIPLFIMFRAFPLAGGNDILGNGGTGLLNSYSALIMPHLASTFGIYLMREFFRMLPSDLIDAARVDGASEFKIFRRIMLPLAKPALSAVAIFNFTFVWNDFLWPLIMTTDPAMRTVQLGLSAFKGQYFTDWHLLMAATLLASLPVLILYLVAQRHFIRGVAMSGMKG
jgi:multiple sugar transport system permease protein